MLRAVLVLSLCACATPQIQKAVPGLSSRTLLINGMPLSITLNEPTLSQESVDRLFDKIEQELVRLYFDRGRYNASISTTVTNLERNWPKSMLIAMFSCFLPRQIPLGMSYWSQLLPGHQ